MITKHQDFDSWKASPTHILKPSLYCCFPWQGRSFCMRNVKGVLCQGHLSSAGGHPWGLHTRNRGLQHVSNDFTKIHQEGYNIGLTKTCFKSFCQHLEQLNSKKHWKRTEHSKMCQLPPSQSIQMLQQEETKVLHCYDELPNKRLPIYDVVPTHFRFKACPRSWGRDKVKA